MENNHSTKDVTITHLKTYDADDLARFAQGWDQEYIQLKKGVFEMESKIIHIAGFQLIEQFSSVPILYRGKSPTKTFLLVIPILNQGETFYGGKCLSENCCFTGNFNGYLDLRTSNQSKFFFITAPLEEILANAQQMQFPLTEKQLLSPGVIVTNSRVLKHLSNYVEELLMLEKMCLDRLTDNSQKTSRPHLIIENFLSLFLNVLTSQVNFLSEKDSHRRKLVKRAEAFMRDRLAEPINLTDLCQELNKSQRSLYYAFQEYFGLPPMEYLKILRLHSVRRALKSAFPGASNVTKIAENFGFWHMGQFSVDYKKMFGESPSTTFRRNSFRETGRDGEVLQADSNASFRSHTRALLKTKYSN